MTLNRLPPELLGIIVDNLHDDLSSIKSCSLVFRAFIHPTRAHIFCKVKIVPPPLAPPAPSSPSSSENLEPEETASKPKDATSKPPRVAPGHTSEEFFEVLTVAPWIAPLVEDLEIVLVGAETNFEFDEDGVYVEDQHPLWIMEDSDALTRVLPLLMLKCIALVESSPAEWNVVGRFCMKWDALGDGLKTALLGVFSSPRLESAHLRGIKLESPRQLLSFFSAAMALKELSLSRTYFTQRWDQRDTWSTSQKWHPQLQALLVSDTDGDSLCTHFLNPQINLTGLRELTLSTEHESRMELLAQILLSSPIEHLRLWYMRGAYRDQDIRTFFHANLRSLRLFTPSIFLAMYSLFNAYPTDSRLEYLTFEGPADDRPRWERGAHNLSSFVEWTLMHETTLKKVEIKTYPWAAHDPPVSEWAAVVRVCLPALVDRGLLTITEIPDGNDGARQGWE